MMRAMALAACAALLAAGCGGSGTTPVEGELKHKGQVYKPAQGEQTMVVFVEERDGKVTGKTWPTRVDANGRYKIAGPDNKGIPPGKYRVAVTSVPEVPVPGKPMEDKFQGAYEMAKTPIVVEVGPGKKDVPIDLP